MALVGKFVADFGSFVDAVEKANVKLADFGKGASGVESKLNSMVDNFSGRKIIQEVTLMSAALEKSGGISTLTASELEKVGNKAAEASEKLKKLGIEVPPELSKITDEAKKASGAMEGFGSNLKIEELITNPMGAAKNSVVEFGAALGPAGVAAAGFALGAVAIGAALFELTKTAAEAGGKLNDVGEVLGIAVPQVSRLSNAATVAGTDLTTMSNALFMLQKNMEENPDKFEKGLARLNIDVAEFKSLSPDQELLALSRALQAVDDPVQRNAAGFELMGRQFRDLAPALFKLDDALMATADIQPWTDEQAKKAEAFDMQLQSIKIHAESVGISLGRTLIEPLATLIGFFTSAAGKTLDLAGGLGGVLSPVGAIRSAFGTASAALEVFGLTAGDTTKEIDKLALAQSKLFDATHAPDVLVKKWKDSLVDLTPKMVTLNQALANQALVMSDLDPKTKTHIDTMNKEAAAAEKAAAAQQKFLDSVKGFSFGTFVADTSKLNAVIPDLSGHTETMAAVFADARDHMNDLDASSIAFNTATIETADGVSKLYTALSTLPNVVSSIKAADDSTSDSLKTFAKDLSGLSSEFAKLAQISGGSFGGVTQSIGKQVAEFSLLTKSIDQFKKSQSDMTEDGKTDYAGMATAVVGMGASAVGTFEGIRNGTVSTGAGIVSMAAKGAAIGSIIPGIGTAIGGAIGAVAGVIAHFTKGVSEAEKQGRDLEAQYEATYGGFQGMIDKIGSVYTDTGRTAAQAQADVQALFAAEQQGPDAVKAAIGKINQAFVEQKAKIDADTSALGLLLKSGQDLGVTLPKSLQDSIQKLIDLGKVSGDTKDILATLSGGTTVSFSTMRDIASKYGADLEALGPKFEAAKIGDTAAGIINDFDTLQRGLDDTDEALTVLRKPINDLVNDSLKFGVAIPQNFKPWIDQLEKTGQLTDVNGNKLEDLSGLKFADPIKTQFDILIDSIKALVDKIAGAGGLNAAINSIPDKTVHVGFQVDAPPDLSGYGGGDGAFAAGGGLVTSYGVQRLAGGGRILPFPGSASGIDTVPIWAAAGEGVVNRKGMSTIGASGLAAINSGRGLGGGAAVVDTSEQAAETAALRQDFNDLIQILPKMVRDAVQLAPRRAA